MWVGVRGCDQCLSMVTVVSLSVTSYIAMMSASTHLKVLRLLGTAPPPPPSPARYCLVLSTNLRSV